MENSHLARLPPELRDHIYDAALQSRETILLGSKKTQEVILPSTDWTTPIAISLLLACRQIQEEATKRLYGSNTFSIVHNQGDVSCEDNLQRFLTRIGGTNAKSLRSMRVSYTLTQGTIFNGEFRHHMMKLRRAVLQIPDCAVKVDLSFIDIYKSLLITVRLDLQNLGGEDDNDRWIGKFETSVASSMEESVEVQDSMRFLRSHLRECRRDLWRI